MSLCKVTPITRSGQVWSSQQSIQIPATNVLSYVFGKFDQYDIDKPVSPNKQHDLVAADIAMQVYIDANQPELSISAREARNIILRLIEGLKAAGLEDGDCVCLHAFNSVSLHLVAQESAGAAFSTASSLCCAT
jgi:hypothetical protein